MRMLGTVVLLAALYSAGWWFLSSRVQAGFDRSLAVMAQRGVVAQCHDRDVGGYPFHIRLSCSSISYEDDANGMFATAGALRSTMGAQAPRTAVSELHGPLQLAAPDMPRLSLDWTRLDARVEGVFATLERAALAGAGIAGRTQEGEGLFNLASLEAVLTPHGADLIYEGRLGGLRIDPAALDGRALPPLDAYASLRIFNGAGLLDHGLESLRGQSVEIAELKLATADSSVAISGPLAVRGDGLIDATLKVRIENAAALAPVLKEFFPERQRDIDRVMVGMALLGRNITLPLTITAGAPALGPVPLRPIPPLD